MNEKVTREKFFEMPTLEQIHYLERSELGKHIFSYFKMYDAYDSFFDDFIEEYVSQDTGGWRSILAGLQNVESVVDSSYFVYRDMENDCWDEWHELDNDSMKEIIDSFDCWIEYSELFSDEPDDPDEPDEPSFAGLEVLL